MARNHYHCPRGQPVTDQRVLADIVPGFNRDPDQPCTTEQEVANLQRQVDEAQWKADLELAVKKKGDYIQGAVDEHFIWHPVVAALERAMVPGVRLDTVQFLASGDVNITGRTDTVKLAADFWGSIQAETGLKIVRLTTVQAESSFNMILRGSDG